MAETYPYRNGTIHFQDCACLGGVLYFLFSLAIFSNSSDVSDSQGSVNDNGSNPSSSNPAQGGIGQVFRPNTTHEDPQRVLPGNNTYLSSSSQRDLMVHHLRVRVRVNLP